MKNTLFVLLILALMFSAAPGFAQTAVTRTTLSAAVSGGSANNIVTLASATGISVSTASTQYFILVDKELMQLRSVLTGTTYNVIRGVNGTAAVGHLSGEQVIFGQGGGFNPNTGNAFGVFMGNNGNTQPTGSCTRTSQQYLPVFAISGQLNNLASYDCLGGQWVQGTLPDQPAAIPLILASNIPIGSVAYGSLGTNTTGVATVEWLTSIMVPQTGWVTGIKVLSGGTATTDKILAVLRDSAGNVIANSATAGQLLSGASTFQTLAFTTPQFVVGGTKYFIGVQTNGTTAGDIRTIAASTYVNVVTGQLTGGTFGTIVNPGTMPTTFTADQGPIVEIYY